MSENDLPWNGFMVGPAEVVVPPDVNGHLLNGLLLGPKGQFPDANGLFLGPNGQLPEKEI